MAQAKGPAATEQRSMLALLQAHWVSMSVSVVLLSIATVLTLMQPILAGWIVDRATERSPLLPIIVTLGTVLVVQLLLEAIGHFQLERTGEKIVYQLRAAFTNHVVRLPIGLLDRGRVGDLLARGTNDAGLVRDMPRAVADVVFGALTLIGASIFMLTIDTVIVIVIVVIMGLALGAGGPFLSRIQAASLNRQAALSDYTSALERALGAVRTVKVFGAEEREVKSISVSAQAAYQSGVSIASSTAVAWAGVGLGVFGPFLANMDTGRGRFAKGALPVGDFVSLFAFAMY